MTTNMDITSGFDSNFFPYLFAPSSFFVYAFFF